MSRDPFDALRDANPVPSDSLPPAPMGEADRIMGGAGRTPWRRPGWAMAVAAAVAVLAAGGAWMLWLGADQEISAADPTTATTSPATTATAAVMPTIQTAVFLLDDTPTGPVVVPVPRAAVAGDEADGALEALLAGPSSDELLRDLTTAIPDGIDGPPPQIVGRGAGTVFVWVPQAWVDFGYPTPDGMAQIAFTLTGIDGVDGVGFLLGDDRVAGGAVAGSGALVPEEEFADHPLVDEVVTRLTYEGWMPLAFVERPASGAAIVLPHPVFGYANSIGNQVRLTLEVDEQTLWMETVTATCGTPWSRCRGEWDWSSWATEIPDLGYTGRANLVAEAFGSGVEVIDRRVSPITIVAASPSAATTISPTTTMVDPFADVPSELAVYLLMDADATHATPGPHLVPASRMTAILSSPLTDAPRQAVEWLLLGPLPGWLDANPAISTAIPEETRLLGLEVAEGVATVDLSSEFVGGGGSLSMTARLAQVVFTLTRFDEIGGVRFTIEGVPTTVFGGDGVIVGDPATRADFPDLVPPIMIETPMWWSTAAEHPLLVSGTAAVFEGTVGLALLDGEGEEILWEGYATATCGTGCRGDWSVEIPYTVPFDQMGSVIAWEESARDGSLTNIREHPVWLRAVP